MSNPILFIIQPISASFTGSTLIDGPVTLTKPLIGTSSMATSSSFATTSSAATSITFVPLTASYAETAGATGGGLTGGGQPNKVAVFSGTNALGTGSITDNGSIVTVSASLNVSGNISLLQFSVTASAFKGDGSQITGVISSSFANTASAATSLTFIPTTSSFATTSSAATSITFVPATSSFATNTVNLNGKASGSFTGSLTGSVLGNAATSTTASAATSITFTPVTSSYAVTASFAANAGGSNFSNTGSFTGSFTGSLKGNADTSTTASFALTASLALAASGTITNAISSSYAATASFAPLDTTDGDLRYIQITGSSELTGSILVDGTVTSSFLRLGNTPFITSPGGYNPAGASVTQPNAITMYYTGTYAPERAIECFDLDIGDSNSQFGGFGIGLGKGGFASTGQIVFYGIQVSGTTQPFLQVQRQGTNSNIQFINCNLNLPHTSTKTGFIGNNVNGGTSQLLWWDTTDNFNLGPYYEGRDGAVGNGMTLWIDSPTGSFIWNNHFVQMMKLSGSGQLGIGTVTPRGTTHIFADSPSSSVLIVQGEVNQTADLTQWMTSSFGVIAKVGIDGGISASYFVGDASQLNNLVSASYSQTASFAATAQTLLGSVTSASYAGTASLLLGSVVSASYATTSSYAVNTTNVNGIGTGSFTGSFTGSLLGNASTATTASAATSITFVPVTASYANNSTNLNGIATGSFTGSFTGSLLGNASIATTSSAATSITFIPATASYANNSSLVNGQGSGSFTGSFTGSVLGNASTSTSASYAGTSSLLLGSVVTASYALTASFAANGGAGGNPNASQVQPGTYPNGTFTYTGSLVVTGNLNVDGQISASSLIGNGAQVTGVVSSSYAVTSSAATSITFNPITSSYANNATNLNGIATGSFTGSFTGSLLGNASTATTASAATSITFVPITSSYAVTSSFTLTASTASISSTATLASNAAFATSASVAATASLLLGTIATASYANNTTNLNGTGTGSFTGSVTGTLQGNASTATTASAATSITFIPVTASYANNTSGLNGIGTGSFTGSFTGSVLGNASTATTSSAATSITFTPVTASYAVTASFAANGGTGGPINASQVNPGTYPSGTFIYTGSLQVTGTLHSRTNVTIVTGSYTASIGDQFISVDASGSTASIYLPGAGAIIGAIFTVRKEDNSVNPVVIYPSGTDTIDYNPTRVLYNLADGATLVAGPSLWMSDGFNTSSLFPSASYAITASAATSITFVPPTSSYAVTSSILTERSNIVLSTTSQTAGSTATGSVVLAKTFILYGVSTNGSASRVRLYSSSSFQTADALRNIGSDPSASSGVIADIVTSTSSSNINITPFIIGANVDSPPTGAIYYYIQNRGTSTSVIQATFTILPLEA